MDQSLNSPRSAIQCTINGNANRTIRVISTFICHTRHIFIAVYLYLLPEMFGMLVHSCVVDDGQGKQIQVINDRGLGQKRISFIFFVK